MTHRQTASAVTEPRLHSQFACSGCRLVNAIYQAQCPERLSPAPARAFQPLSCTPVTSCHCLPEFNRSEQSVCKRSHSLLQSQQPGKWPSGPALPRAQELYPSCLSSGIADKGSGSWVGRGGGGGRGSKEGMGMGRLGAWCPASFLLRCSVLPTALLTAPKPLLARVPPYPGVQVQQKGPRNEVGG